MKFTWSFNFCPELSQDTPWAVLPDPNFKQEIPMDRNDVYRKLSVALNLKDHHIKQLMDLGGVPVSKSAVQDMKRIYNPARPEKSRRVYEEHLLALLVGIEASTGQDVLPIEPLDSLMAVVRGIRIAIGAGEPWPIYGQALENRMEWEILKHRGEKPPWPKIPAKG